MSVRDDLGGLDVPRGGNRSGPRLIDRIVASFDGDDRVAIVEALNNPAHYPATKLARYLTAKGRPVSHQSISVWRADHGIT